LLGPIATRGHSLARLVRVWPSFAQSLLATCRHDPLSLCGISGLFSKNNKIALTVNKEK
jgi:hypothetical protein